MKMSYTPCRGDVLLAVDIQNDFCPGGALPVHEGDMVVPVINRLGAMFDNVILTQDWHPAGHFSFASSYPGKKPFETVTLPYGEQMLWPDHCIQGSKGAEFHKDLHVDNATLIIRKGFHQQIDSYSAFYENDRKTTTGLSGYLRDRGITRVFIAGLATDFCVAYSVIDARSHDFEVIIIEDGCRAIDMGGSLDAAWKQFESVGVTRIVSSDISHG